MRLREKVKENGIVVVSITGGTVFEGSTTIGRGRMPVLVLECSGVIVEGSDVVWRYASTRVVEDVGSLDVDCCGISTRLGEG